jgi:crotonobetainyl-CoA:carnitine CoA-transferase CaiB-like acyl-CoA transferase
MLQSDRFWPEMCEAMGRPELIADERFATAAARAENIGACMAELEETFASHTLAEWRTLLADVSGVWAAVQSSTDLLEDPQVLANGYLAEVGSGEERFRLVTSPAQFDAHAPTLTGAPEVGEHTDEILAELGRDWEQIIQLKIDGTVT